MFKRYACVFMSALVYLGASANAQTFVAGLNQNELLGRSFTEVRESPLSDWKNIIHT